MASVSAIYVTAWDDTEKRAVLPPNQATPDAPLHLATRDGDGFTVKSYVPGGGTCIVEVRADTATHALLQADPAYLFVGEVA